MDLPSVPAIYVKLFVGSNVVLLLVVLWAFLRRSQEKKPRPSWRSKIEWPNNSQVQGIAEAIAVQRKNPASRLAALPSDMFNAYFLEGYLTEQCIACQKRKIDVTVLFFFVRSWPNKKPDISNGIGCAYVCGDCESDLVGNSLERHERHRKCDMCHETFRFYADSRQRDLLWLPHGYALRDTHRVCRTCASFVLPECHWCAQPGGYHVYRNPPGTGDVSRYECCADCMDSVTDCSRCGNRFPLTSVGGPVLCADCK